MGRDILFLLAGVVASFGSVTALHAQVGPTNSTEHYEADGTYKGTPVHSVDVDFTKWSTTDLVMNEELQEKDNIGFYKFVVAERTFPPAWEASVCLHNNNPVLPLGNNQKEMAKIYFPTMEDGVGSIRLCGYVSDGTARPIQVNYFVEGQSSDWEWKGGLSIPNKSGDVTQVEMDINVPGKVRIGLFYNQAAWPSIKSISISAYGEGLPEDDVPEEPVIDEQTFALMRQNMLEKIVLGKGYDVPDGSVSSRISSITTSAKNYWSAMEKSPSTYLWSDYNKLKGDASNTPGHVYYTYGRLLTMAQAYCYEGRLYHDEELLNDIVAGLDFMYEYAFNENTSRIGNFWEWHMGTPDYYARIVSLLYDVLPQRVKTNYFNTIVAQLRNFVEKGNYTYGNQATACVRLLYCGVLCNSAEDIDIALRSLVRAFVNKTTVSQRKTAQAEFEKLWKAQGDYHDYMPAIGKKEGLYEDGTFIQHIALPYIGGYGSEIIEASSKVSAILEGSGIGLPDEIVESLYTWVTKAYFPTIYEGEMMMMYMGRGVKRNPHDVARAIALNIAESADLLTDADQIRDIKGVCKRMLTDNGYYPDVYSGFDPILDKPRVDRLLGDVSVPVAGVTPFNVVMAAGDRVIHNRPDFRFGISMSSSRIGKFESLNNENTRGWYLGEGMTYIYNSTDRSQYVNYFNLVNMQRLPGTTVDVLARSVLKTSNYGLFGIPVNAQDWTGGTSLNGIYGVAGMHLVSEVGSLEGRKSWFMFDNEVVALGAGISMTEERAAETVVENRNSLKSLYVDGVLKPSTKGWSEALPSPRWISLEGTGGYYFPQPSTVNAMRDYNGFTQLYFDHGTSPENEGYAYVLLPSSTREETEAYAARPEIEVVCNTDNIQAVRETGLRVMGINFWQAGQVDNIVCDAPAAVMVREDRGMLYVSLADPTWKQTSVRLSLAGSYRMTGEDGRVRLEANGDRTDVVFDVTDRMGQCIEVSLVDNDYSGLDEGCDDGPVYVWERGSATAIVRNMEPGGRVVVYDARGRLCRVATAVPDELRMDFSGYEKGVYIIRYCRPDGRSYVWKFVNM